MAIQDSTTYFFKIAKVCVTSRRQGTDVCARRNVGNKVQYIEKYLRHPIATTPTTKCPLEFAAVQGTNKFNKRVYSRTYTNDLCFLHCSNHVLGVHFCVVPWDLKADRLKRICRSRCSIFAKRRKKGQQADLPGKVKSLKNPYLLF